MQESIVKISDQNSRIPAYNPRKYILYLIRLLYFSFVNFFTDFLLPVKQYARVIVAITNDIWRNLQQGADMI
ncbi:hypothetical protein P3S67_003033 [Capsicum chacoense]